MANPDDTAQSARYSLPGKQKAQPDYRKFLRNSETIQATSACLEASWQASVTLPLAEKWGTLTLENAARAHPECEGRMLIRVALLRLGGRESSSVSTTVEVPTFGWPAGAEEPMGRDTGEMEMCLSPPHPGPPSQRKKCSTPNLDPSQDRATY